MKYVKESFSDAVDFTCGIEDKNWQSSCCKTGR